MPPQALAEEAELECADEDGEGGDRDGVGDESPDADGIAEAFEHAEDEEDAGLDGG